MPKNSPRYRCPRSLTTFCISAKNCREGKEPANLQLCPLSGTVVVAMRQKPATKAARTMLEKRLTLTHEAKPHQRIHISKAEWVRIQKSKKGGEI